MNDESHEPLVRELDHLRGDVEKVNRRIESPPKREMERRTSGVDRRRNSRTDRREMKQK
jgi:hypothetical protein